MSHYPGAYSGGQPPYGGSQPPGGFPPTSGGFPPSSGYPGGQPAGAYGQPPAGGYPGAAPGHGVAAPYGQPNPYGAPLGGGWGGPPPGVDPQIFNWFQAVDIDRSGKITATELQQALTNANWSHFNPETCRLMIGMFDRDQSGTIDLHEFQSLWNYIQQWKGVFEQFDNDRSGSIEANELQNAFNQMGYRLSPQFAQLIVCRYDPLGRRRLTLDNFIQSCVQLKSVTDTFKQKDSRMEGIIHVNYEEFLTMVLLNRP